MMRWWNMWTNLLNVILCVYRSFLLTWQPWVLRSDGNSEHVAHPWRRTGHFGKKIKYVTGLDLFKCLKQIKLQRLILTYAPDYELPSNISTVQRVMKCNHKVAWCHGYLIRSLIRIPCTRVNLHLVCEFFDNFSEFVTVCNW